MSENFQRKENSMTDHRKLLQAAMKRRRIQLSATQIIAIGFAAIILLGAGLLTLPAASRSGSSCGFFPALFTATSATCVTGLVKFDTWSQFSGFGQTVILCLIEIGGLGFMSVATFFLTFSKKNIKYLRLLVMGHYLVVWRMKR